MAIARHPGPAGSSRSVPGTFVRGYESVRYPCEEGYDYAEGYSAREADTWCLGWAWLRLG